MLASLSSGSWFGNSVNALTTNPFSGLYSEYVTEQDMLLRKFQQGRLLGLRNNRDDRCTKLISGDDEWYIVPYETMVQIENRAFRLYADFPYKLVVS